MDSIDSEHLINYFRNRKGKHLKLRNGEKIKLEKVFANMYTLSLTFTQDGKEIYISFDGLYREHIKMIIPHGLQEGVFMSPYVKFGNLKILGYTLENILIN
ncbi:hypothetical protein CF5_0178 [Staphylococcus phage CF5]|uniref:Uncharacterized protein n=1 Tax=Staphylococcus phage CF5 TaxID=3113739 RepID=A0AAX4J7S7_9CAUD|nr:hypothetical protein CF5_0178 [Staphylococcus phage CF5]